MINITYYFILGVSTHFNLHQGEKVQETTSMKTLVYSSPECVVNAHAYVRHDNIYNYYYYYYKRKLNASSFRWTCISNCMMHGKWNPLTLLKKFICFVQSHAFACQSVCHPNLRTRVCAIRRISQ